MSGSRPNNRVRPAPLSIRLNDAERRALIARAGALPLSTYVKQAALGPEGATSRSRWDREPVARVLAILGHSGIGASLSQLASFAASGSLELDERTRNQILDACEDVRAVRELLMLALGKRSRTEKPPCSSSPFNEAAQ